MSAPNRRCSSKSPVPPKSLPAPPTTRGVWSAPLKVPSAHWGAVGTTLRTTSVSSAKVEACVAEHTRTRSVQEEVQSKISVGAFSIM